MCKPDEAQNSLNLHLDLIQLNLIPQKTVMTSKQILCYHTMLEFIAQILVLWHKQLREAPDLINTG
jgi:hypothetical protein